MPRKDYRERIEQELKEIRRGKTTRDEWAEIEFALPEKNAEMIRTEMAKYPPVAELFRDAKLSPDNWAHWVELVGLFAFVHYTFGKPGRPKDDEVKLKLKVTRHIAALKRESNKKLSKTELCARLAASGRYAIKTAAGARTMLDRLGMELHVARKPGQTKAIKRQPYLSRPARPGSKR